MSHPVAQPGFRSVLARPAYRRLWAARTVSQCGDIAQFTTVALLVLRLTGSGLGVSGAALAEIAPVLIVAPLAGTLVDRLPRVQVMVGADLVRLLIATVLAVWHGDVAVVYAAAFGLSAGSTFFNPAAGSLLPALVADEDLVAANSGIWSAAVLSQVILAPLAGLLAVTAGYGWAFALNAGSFAVSAMLLRGLGVTQSPAPVAGSLWTQGVEALSLLSRDRLLRALAVAQALAALSAGATSALLVVLARERLDVGGGRYGLMLTAIGVGAFAGPLLLARFSTAVRRPRLVFAAFGLRGAVDLILASVSALPAALGALIFYGLGTSTGNVTFSSVIQSRVPASLRGRVFSAFDLIWQAMRLASLVLGGLLADRLGIRAVYYLGGALLVAAAIAGMTTATGSRRRTAEAGDGDAALPPAGGSTRHRGSWPGSVGDLA